MRPLAPALALVTLACTPSTPASATVYRPRARDITVTTVPLLVREGQSIYPFLKSDFARGGVLDGKEVYAFVPSTLTVVEGDVRGQAGRRLYVRLCDPGASPDDVGATRRPFAISGGGRCHARTNPVNDGMTL